MDDRSRSVLGRGRRPCVSGCGRVPSHKEFRGITPSKIYYICYATMCIIEYRICIDFGDENIVVVGFVVETVKGGVVGGENGGQSTQLTVKIASHYSERLGFAADLPAKF